MNSLDNNVKESDSEEQSAAEKQAIGETTEPVDHGHGHLQEIEVDLDHAVHDREVKDIGEDTSPYPEVRAVVPEIDDPDIPVKHPKDVDSGHDMGISRGWCQSILLATLSRGCTSFSIVAELLAYPMGVFLAHVPAHHDS